MPTLKQILLAALFGIAVGSPSTAPGEQGPERLRLMIETDAGGDPDDEQSLVRFLLYANEWDIEGIIANRARAREGENLNSERTGLGIVRRMIEAYATCCTNLVQHDSRYPPPEILLRRTVSGYSDSEEGVRLVVNALQSEDRRPLWFLNWGTDHGSSPSCLKRALDQILERRGQQAYAALKARIRLSSADAFGDHTWKIAPPWALWVDTFNPELSGGRWYHRFSALTAGAGGFDIDKDVRLNHGPLGTLYPTNTTHPQKEGDTMTFMYLIPTGLGDPEEPTWGSWAGRYGLRDSSGRQYYWANQSDVWSGTTNRDNTLLRWAIALQNDFKARLDWCVQPFTKANHPPHLVLNGSDGTAVLRIEATPGAFVDFDLSGSSDPDSDNLSFDCFVYPEAGTCPGSPNLMIQGRTARLNLPKEAAGKAIHVIVAATDSGSPPLTRYRRAVVKVRPATKPSS